MVDFKNDLKVVRVRRYKSVMYAVLKKTMFILMPLATFDSVTVYLLVIFIVVIIIWIWNVRSLNEEYVKFRGEN